VRELFPECRQVTSYASPSSIRVRTEEELRTLREKGLTMVYMGLESGSDEVLTLMRKGHPAAEIIGSVNTLVRREGKLIGYNTDIDGFLYTLRRAGISLKGKKVLILGSGGASLTARAAAKTEGARQVVVVSRAGEDNYENLPDRHGDAEVLINTTPVGMWPKLEGSPVDLRLLPKLTDVADVIYNPGRTNLLLQAEELGLRTVLGVSNISFGLPNRGLITQSFLTQALAAGLTLPILNPNQREMMDAVAAFRVLSGEDGQCRAYVERFAGVDAASVPAWAKDSVASLVEQKVVGGSNGQLRPSAAVSRAEVAKMLLTLW